MFHSNKIILSVIRSEIKILHVAEALDVTLLLKSSHYFRILPVDHTLSTVGVFTGIIVCTV